MLGSACQYTVKPAGTRWGLPAPGGEAPALEVPMTTADLVFVALTVALFSLFGLVVRGVGKL